MSAGGWLAANQPTNQPTDNHNHTTQYQIRHGPSFLHYNFVCALLNDLFGIQTRGGCQCAGPYGLRLLGLSAEEGQAYEDALLEGGLEVLRPGFTRFSLAYYHFDPEVVTFSLLLSPGCVA